MTPGRLAEAVGWVGTVLVLSAYAYSARTGRHRVFHAANTVGSLLIGVSAFSVGAWPSLVVTMTFGVIGAVAPATEGRQG